MAEYSMNEVIKEWIDKAEGDYFSAGREYRARKHPNYDAARFHAQQCIEKYLKGTLQSNSTEFDKTHDLAVLLKACSRHNPLWAPWEDDMKMLSRFAVMFRYPGECATREDAGRALRAMKIYRIEIRKALGLQEE